MAMYCYGKGDVCDVPCTNEACEHFNNTGAAEVRVPTVSDKLRSMPKTEMADKLLKLSRLLLEVDRNLTELWCDGCGACITMDDNDECDEDMHKACILRYLDKPAEEVTADGN